MAAVAEAAAAAEAAVAEAAAAEAAEAAEAAAAAAAKKAAERAEAAEKAATKKAADLRMAQEQLEKEGLQVHISTKSGSGFKGVHVASSKAIRGFKAVHYADGVETTLGYYDSAVEAAVAYARYVATLEAEEVAEAAATAAEEEVAEVVEVEVKVEAEAAPEVAAEAEQLPDIFGLLSMCNLTEYAEMFVDEGYDDVAFLCEMQDDALHDVLTEVGMTKIGYRKRFLQAMAKVRASVSA